MKIKVISGVINRTRGPVRDIITDPEYLDVSVPIHSGFIHATKPDHTVFAYVGLFLPAEEPVLL